MWIPHDINLFYMASMWNVGAWSSIANIHTQLTDRGEGEEHKPTSPPHHFNFPRFAVSAISTADCMKRIRNSAVAFFV